LLLDRYNLLASWKIDGMRRLSVSASTWLERVSLDEINDHMNAVMIVMLTALSSDLRL
jgi:hypothetical protein